MNWLYIIIIGALAGWLAGIVWKGSGFGLIGNIITGIVGGMLGGWIQSQFHILEGGVIMQILIAAAGALILLFLLRLIKG